MDGLIFVFLSCALVQHASSIIPRPCATVENLRSKECCPDDTDPCGKSKSRGECVNVTEPTNNEGDDLRYHWPTRLFNKLCECKDNYSGYDCSECKFGYEMNAAGQCELQPVRVRKSLKMLDWKTYISLLNETKYTPSRYYVVTETFNTAIKQSNDRALMDSIFNPTLYNLFIWIHHYSAKDNESKEIISS